VCYAQVVVSILAVFQVLFFCLWAFEIGPVAAWSLAVVFVPSMIYVALWVLLVVVSAWLGSKDEAFLRKLTDMADRGSRIGK